MGLFDPRTRLNSELSSAIDNKLQKARIASIEKYGAMSALNVDSRNIKRIINGNGSTTSFLVNHQLATTDLSVTCYHVASGQDVAVTLTRNDINNVTVNFSAPPSADDYKVILVRI